MVHRLRMKGLYLSRFHIPDPLYEANLADMLESCMRPKGKGSLRTHSLQLVTLSNQRSCISSECFAKRFPTWLEQLGAKVGYCMSSCPFLAFLRHQGFGAALRLLHGKPSSSVVLCGPASWQMISSVAFAAPEKRSSPEKPWPHRTCSEAPRGGRMWRVERCVKDGEMRKGVIIVDWSGGALG